MSGALFPFRKPPVGKSSGSSSRKRSFNFLRRWLDGDLNWRKRLAKTGLPPLVKETITEVVDQKKLTSGERLSVTNELVAHFEDGYEGGESYLTLLSEFGDTQIAATLIGRAKERNRSMFSMFMKIFGLMVLFSAVSAAIFAGLFTMREASPSVDYLPVFNTAAAEADESEKAWPIYRPMWIKHRFCDHRLHDRLYFVNEETDERRLMKSGDPNWDQAVVYLDERKDLLDAFRKGSRLPVFGLELQLTFDDYSDEDLQAIAPNYWDGVLSGEIPRPNPVDLADADERLEVKVGIVGILLPHVQKMRDAVRMFHVDTRRAVVDSDSERAVGNIETSFGIARQATEHPVLVCALVGLDCRTIALQQIEELIVEHPGFLSEEQLGYVQELVAADNLHEFVSLDGECAFFNDIVQQFFTDDGEGNGQMTWDGLRASTGLLPGLTNGAKVPNDGFEKAKLMLKIATTDRKSMVETHENLVAIAKEHFAKPFYEQPIELDDLVEEQGDGFFLIETLMPAYDGVRGFLERNIGQQDGAVLAIAIERFKLINGRLPGALDELVPEFITQIPLDRVTGEPVKFMVRGDDPVIYSVGTDGVDNSGVSAVDSRSGTVLRFNFQEDYEGDWVIWPIPARNE